jgi:hypothetical protein
MVVLIHAETKFLFADRILEVNKTKIPIKSLVDVLNNEVPYGPQTHIFFWGQN